jgi:transposase-like protein
LGRKVAIKCIRCGARGRVRELGGTDALATYECRACKSVFTGEALAASARAEEAALRDL